MNDDSQRAASGAAHNSLKSTSDLAGRSDLESTELWLPNGTLFNDEAAERFGDVILERARIQLEQERSALH